MKGAYGGHRSGRESCRLVEAVLGTRGDAEFEVDVATMRKRSAPAFPLFCLELLHPALRALLNAVLDEPRRQGAPRILKRMIQGVSNLVDVSTEHGKDHRP